MKLQERKDILISQLETNDLSPEVIGNILESVFPGDSQAKTNDEGQVYCNYFRTYLDADQFATNSKGKYKSRSIKGDKIARKLKSLFTNAQKSILSQFRAKEITAVELDEHLTLIDKNYTEFRGDFIPEGFPYSVEKGEGTTDVGDVDLEDTSEVVEDLGKGAKDPVEDAKAPVEE